MYYRTEYFSSQVFSALIPGLQNLMYFFFFGGIIVPLSEMEYIYI